MRKKILIANRGEIVSRVARTAKKLGMQVWGIYSYEDRHHPYLKDLDQRIELKGRDLASTYLNIELITKICQENKIDCVHPGYGFLSENANFADSLRSQGIIFCGPSSEVIKIMGDKARSKEEASKYGMPVLESLVVDKQSEKELLSFAEKLGYPVLVKASMGGGGKGMRVVKDASMLMSSIESCQREGKSSFGSDRVLIEKYITQPRHIEVQVLGDQHGHYYHFFERECTLQRRHQKVIEEAPSPVLNHQQRERICETARKLAEGLKYEGPGTVEMIVDQEFNFFFLEMNTRLQVEHPVTEAITGVDLVELQIRAALGEEILFKKPLEIHGHAIELRVYAEDPESNFMPQTGRLQLVRDHTHEAYGHVRFDTSVENNTVVGTDYDPMLSKLIFHSQKSRKDCIQSLKELVKSYPHTGLKTNITYLYTLLGQAFFETANFSTHTLEDFHDELVMFDDEIKASMIAVALLESHEDHSCQRIVMINKEPEEQVEFSLGSQSLYLKWKERDWSFRVINWSREKHHIVLETSGGQNLQVRTYFQEHQSGVGKFQIFCYLDHFSLSAMISIKDRAIFLESDHLALGGHLSTMPGKIVKVLKENGEVVKAGEPVLIIEAMKMETEIKASTDGVISSLHLKVGDQILADENLFEVKNDGK